MQETHRHHAHTHAAISPSLLRFSIWQRLAIAAGLTALLWLAVLWALMERVQ
jgi:hypothetical protein